MCINKHKQGGFTLVEMLITMVIAMVILGGLLLNFISQSAMYKYQNKRGDAALDLEFALRFMADDIKNGLVSLSDLNASTAPTTKLFTFDGATTAATTNLAFNVWTEDVNLARDPITFQVRRCYVYDSNSGGGMVKYDRASSTCPRLPIALGATESLIGEKMMGLKGLEVTHFRIFQDGLNDATNRKKNNGSAGSGYVGLPPSLPLKKVTDSQNNTFMMPGFTILLEVAVDAAPKAGGKDVLGNDLGKAKKRIWRYKQVYPTSVLN